MNVNTIDELMANDPAKDDSLILVDAFDRQIGTASKMQAHVEGLLHRAFSVVLLRENNGCVEVLLGKRSRHKYHSAGLWANSCCSHPRAGEELLSAARRRVQEELGCTVEGLSELGEFAYRAEFDNGLCEYEYDHVVVGRYDGGFDLDPMEVEEVRWVTLEDLSQELVNEPSKFAAWAYTVFTLVMQNQ